MKLNKIRIEFIIKMIFLWSFGVIAQENTVSSVELPNLDETAADTVEPFEQQTTVEDTVVQSLLQPDTNSVREESDAQDKSVKNDTLKETTVDTAKVLKPQDLIIESIRSPKPPEIKSNKIIYSIDIQFLRAPLDYWFFYDSLSSRLVCDFYGCHIEKVPELLRRVSIIGSVAFENMETSLALNGKRSQLYFELEPGWHYSSAIISGEILRLSLWKHLKPEEVIKMKRRRVRKIVILALSGVAVVGAMLSYYLN